MKTVTRFRLALAYEELRVPVVLITVGLLLVGSYWDSVASIEGAVALALTPPIAAGVAFRSVWHEPVAVRLPAMAVAGALAVASEVALWGGAAPWQSHVAHGLWLLAACAAAMQFFAAYRGIKTFFAISAGVAAAIGLYAPFIAVWQRPGTVLAALVVALLGGGGTGFLVVALSDKVSSARDASLA